ncbi:hypothetical protein LINGRAHAP2_LOCUS19972 [Linum grandiflorum]
MCLTFISMHGGLLYLPTCIGRLGRLVKPSVRLSWGVIPAPFSTNTHKTNTDYNTMPVINTTPIIRIQF